MEKEIFISELGMRHRRFLRQHHKAIYIDLLTSGRLDDYLLEVDQRANEMKDRLTEQYKKRWGVNEELKAADMMKWVGMMNNINACVREVINSEVIYCL